jgi:hypothetical protein
MDFREDSYSERVLNALTGRIVPLASPQARAERERLRKRVGIWLVRLGLLAFVLSLPWGLSGCSTASSEPAAQVCFMRAIGQTEDGNTVVLQACQSPEEFQASQK